jgi:hypothetical protein
LAAGSGHLVTAPWCDHFLNLVCTDVILYVHMSPLITFLPEVFSGWEKVVRFLHLGAMFWSI